MSDPLTDDQVLDGARQLRVHAELLTHQYQAGVGEYVSLSARQGLMTLGYEDKGHQDQILRYIHDQGFNYCLDPMFPARHDSDEATPAFACVWGCDQLHSRLAWIAR